MRHGHYVQLSKGRVFYRLYNEDCLSTLPPIVLCHGFIGSSEYLIPLIEGLLPSRRRIYALDLYGRGHSDCVDIDNSLELFTEQIREFLDALEIYGPFDLIGYSMGGGVAVQYGAHHLSRLRTITLIAPIGLPSMTVGPSQGLVILLNTMRSISHVLRCGYLHEWLTALVLRSNKEDMGREWANVNTPRFQWYKQHMLQRFEDERETLPRSVSSTVMHLRFDCLSSAYEAIGAAKTLPVLVAWGKEDKTVPCDADGIRTLVPHAHVVCWPDQGHLLPVELAEEVSSKVLAFWSSELDDREQN